MKKTDIRCGNAPRPASATSSTQPGSGMDPQVEDILFSIADAPSKRNHNSGNNENGSERNEENREREHDGS